MNIKSNLGVCIALVSMGSYHKQHRPFITLDFSLWCELRTITINKDCYNYFKETTTVEKTSS